MYVYVLAIEICEYSEQCQRHNTKCAAVLTKALKAPFF